MVPNVKSPVDTYINPFRLSYPSLENETFIRWNPTSDPSFCSPSAASNFIASLKQHFATLPPDPHAPASFGRFRQYARAFILPFEDKPRLRWAPGYVVDGHHVAYYRQGSFNPEHSYHRVFSSIPESIQTEPLLEKLILTDVAMCEWSIHELRHPIVVGVHLIKTAPSEQYPVSKTSPNALHQDGHKFSVIHLVQRHNVVGGENVFTAHGGHYAGLQPEDVPPEDVTGRFSLEKPLDSWACTDVKCSHFASPVMQQVEGPEPSERSVIILDIEPMIAAVCPI